MIQNRANFGTDADKYGWIIIYPLGQRGASWFDRGGMTNVSAIFCAWIEVTVPAGAAPAPGRP